MVFAVFSVCKSSRAAQRLRSDDKRRIVHKPRDETMPVMKVRGTRGVGVSAALIAAAALAFAAGPAWGASGGAAAGKAGPTKLNAARPGPLVKGTGIAQAVSAHAVVVRQLDGSTVRVPVGPRTAVFVDGVRSSLDQVKPGFVVSFAVRLGRPAIEVRARSIASSRPAAIGPTVQSVSADAVVVTRPNGSTATIGVGSRRVFLDGSPATLSAIQPGDVVQKMNPRTVRFRRPG
jgi:hypothetical protein